MKSTFYSLLIVIMALLSCKKNNNIDGGVHDPRVNMTTFDFLKSRGALFDTLILLIERTGLKEQLNGDITFFAPTDYCIRNYMDAKALQRRQQTNDDTQLFSIDSLSVQAWKDTLQLYMVPGKINRTDLEKNGNQLVKSRSGDSVYISLRETREYTDYTPGFRPKILWYTRVIRGLDPDGATVPDANRDAADYCQTSGIITTTGILHVMNDLHVVTFGRK
jgi:Fasciclin domain.